MASRLLVALAVASFVPTAQTAEFPKCGVRVVRGNGKKSGCVTNEYATKYDGRKLAFACCEAETCTRKDKDGVCYVGENAIDYENWDWHKATSKCAAEGKVLCGVEEPCKGKECNYNKRYQWTGEECQAGDADFPVGCESTDEPTGEPTAEPAGEPTAETTPAPTAEFPFCGVRAFRNNGNQVKCVSDPYQTDDRVGAFACCVGDTCSRLDNDEQCFAGHNGEDRKDWYAATAACAAEGKVLCSVEEPCRNSGCGSKYQYKWHWTSEECQDGDADLPLDCTPTPVPTRMPTGQPTAGPTATPVPTRMPTGQPTAGPTAGPTAAPTDKPTAAPTAEPTAGPTAAPNTDVGGRAAAVCLAAGGDCTTCCGGCTRKTPVDGTDFSGLPKINGQVDDPISLPAGECVCFEGELSGTGLGLNRKIVRLTSSNDCAKLTGDFLRIGARSRRPSRTSGPVPRA